MGSQLMLIVLLSLLAASQGQDSACPQYWIDVGDQMCRRFINEFRVTVGDAKAWCESQGAALVRFSNYDDVTAFAGVAVGQPVDGWWSDLNDLGQPGTWTWGGDQSVTPGALGWATEPTDSHHVENCITMETAGYLSDDDCDLSMGFICSYAPNVTDASGCADDYTYASGQCYYVSHLDDDMEKLSWAAAKNACAALEPAPGVFPVLANFTSLDQLQGLQLAVKVSGTIGKRWIGLNDIATEGVWTWADGNRASDTSFLQGQFKIYPDHGTGHSCGLVHSNGQMEEAECLDKHYFVCQQQIKPDNFYLTYGLGCLPPWIRGGSKCYFFNPGKSMTLAETRSFCANLNGRLLKLEDSSERTWVTSQLLRRQMFNMWTGLRRSSPGSNTWVWDDGTAADATLYEWNRQPSQSFLGTDEDCAFVNEFGVYSDENCFTAMSFICEMDAEDVACPKTWLSDNTNDFTTCYYMSNNKTDGLASWKEALDKCQQLAGSADAHLVDITSPQEMDYLRALMTSQPYAGYWTDLTDKVVRGVWAYSQTYYGTPPPIPWDKEPNNLSGNENCAVVYTDGKYADVDCNSRAHIICEKPPSSASLSTTMHRLTYPRDTFLLLALVLFCNLIRLL